MPPFRRNPLRNLPQRVTRRDDPGDDEIRYVPGRGTILTPDTRPEAAAPSQLEQMDPTAAIPRPAAESSSRNQNVEEQIEQDNYIGDSIRPEDPRPIYDPTGQAQQRKRQRVQQAEQQSAQDDTTRNQNSAPTINETPNVFNQAGVTGPQSGRSRTRPRGGQSRQTRPQTRGQNQSRQQGAQRRTGDEPSRQSVSIRQRMERNVGSMGDYLGQQDVQLLPPDATEEDIQAVLDDGGIPVTQPDLSGMEEFVPQPVDFSRSEQALRQFAEAKVNAAKQGALMSQQGARNANTRLLANAFGPGLFQALSGVQQPTNQQTNYNFQAARRMEQANQAQRRAIETGFTAPAQAEVQASQLNREEQQLNRQNELQTQKLNNSIERFRQQARAQAQNRFIDTTLSLAEMERKYDQELEVMEMQAEMEANQANVDQQTKAQITDINKELYRTIKEQQDLEAALNILGQQDLSEDRRNKVVNYIGSQYGVTDDGGALSGLSNEKIMTVLRERRKDAKSRVNNLYDDRREYPYIPQNTAVNPVNIQSDLRGGQQNQGQQAQGQQAQPETPSNQQQDESQETGDAEEEFQSTFGNVNL